MRFFCSGYAFWLLKVSWVSALITRSRARALAAQRSAESREGLPDSPSAVEWPSLPALPTPPQQPSSSRFQGVLRSFRKVPSAQSPRPPLPVGHIPPDLLDPLQDSEFSEPPSSSESEESSLPSLQISLTSEPVSNNSEHRNISGPDSVFNHSSESQLVIGDHVPMSRQERADDSVRHRSATPFVVWKFQKTRGQS